MPASPDMAGQVFGEWKVISRAYSDPRNGWSWICQCSCGALDTVEGSALRRGRTTRCRACQHKRQIDDLTGRTFGQWTVLSQAPNRNGATMWNVRCSCGTHAVVVGQTLKRTGRNASTRCRPCANRAQRKTA